MARFSMHWNARMHARTWRVSVSKPNFFFGTFEESWTFGLFIFQLYFLSAMLMTLALLLCGD